ncbi:uncharacterized protein LOC129742209 isoform X1 [Uranotaenia lowii]|uniref:uncharacterized protein LOC129742209 isoform X1 n=1 Tax=Uranotaenia lowii TaxID=190385 RepID=UPI00247AD0E8|nr:uncharacterized protein LOC129742209 isoform X1 [Uranotaenia lowii]
MNRRMNPRLIIILIVCGFSTRSLARAGVKQKRLLYDLSDPFLTVTEPTPYYHSTTFLPSGPIYSAHAPILDHHVIKPLPTSIPTFLSAKPSSLDSIYKSNFFEYSNYGSPFHFIGGNHLGYHDTDTYIADGRILKQYSVTEHHPEEIERNRLLQTNIYHPRTTATAPTYFPSKYQPFYNTFLQQPTTTATFPPVIGYNPRLHQNLSPVLTKNHGPVALGSGSIGYIHGPNGVALGSGSLGYISHKQHQDSLSELFARKSRKHRPSPLHFGHNHD